MTETKTKNKRRRILFAGLGMSEQKISFLENLSLMLSSGIDVWSSLDSLQKDENSKPLRRILASLRDDIEDGLSLSQALERLNLYPGNVISLVRTGEKSGRLTENLRLIVTQLKKQRQLRSRIISSMFYPVLILTVAVSVGLGIAWFILPKLANVFVQLDIELPKITLTLIGIGEFLQVYGRETLLGVVVLIPLLFYFLFGNKKSRFIGQAILFHLPVSGRIIKEVEISHFGYLFGTLLKAGLPIMEALDILQKETNIRAYQKFYISLKSTVEQGNSLQKSFQSYRKISKLFPGPVQHMIAAAEQSGHLSETLIDIGNTYEEKSDTTAKNLSVLLEPFMLIIVWSGVVLIALAVIMPIYGLIGGLNNPANAPQPTVIIDEQQTAPEPEGEEQPQPSESGGEAAPEEQQVEILESPTGFVNIREGPATTEPIIKRALPGERYEYVDEEEEWYRIKVDVQTEGFVNKTYARKE